MPADTPPAPPATRRRMLLWVALFCLVLLVPLTLVPTALLLFSKPAFESVDELSPDKVTGIGVFILNRPDGGPDVGRRDDLFQVPPADRDAVLGLLRGAQRVDLTRGIWLGRMVVTLADGRRQAILLYRPESSVDKDKPGRLRFKIGDLQYEGPPVDEFVRALVAIEAKAKP